MTSNLLKFARARDDQEFNWRISAAMMVRAQEIAQFELSPASRSLTDWVLNNPMTTHERIVAFVSTNTSIASAITVDGGGTVDTSNVTDSDIQYVVNEVWDKVAATIFSPTHPAKLKPQVETKFTAATNV